MFSRIWTFSHRKEFAEKRIKKAEGAFKNFPRFACAHCGVKKILEQLSITRFFTGFEIPALFSTATAREFQIL